MLRYISLATKLQDKEERYGLRPLVGLNPAQGSMTICSRFPLWWCPA